MLSNLADRRLEGHACLVDGARPERPEPKATALIERQRGQVVVSRDGEDRDVANAPAKITQERRPDADPWLGRDEDGQLALDASIVSRKARALAVDLGNEAGQGEDIDELAAPGLHPAAELMIEQRLGPIEIALRLECPDSGP